jgi:hypothetical protein
MFTLGSGSDSKVIFKHAFRNFTFSLFREDLTILKLVSNKTGS